MAVKTVEQYYDSLKNLHPKAYILGEVVENVYEHPLKPGHTMIVYDRPAGGSNPAIFSRFG